MGFNLGALHIFCLIIILFLHFLISSLPLFSKYDARNSDELLWAQENATLTAAFDDDDVTARKFKSIAQMIGSHECRGSDRDLFYMVDGTYDHHSDVLSNQNYTFYRLNAGLGSFVEELQSQGNWDDVTIVVSSDFGR